MTKWFLATMLALSLIGGLTPLLRKIGLGRLPGDLSFTLRGREYNFPFASSLILSALASLIFYLLH